MTDRSRPGSVSNRTWHRAPSRNAEPACPVPADEGFPTRSDEEGAQRDASSGLIGLNTARIQLADIEQRAQQVLCGDNRIGPPG